MACRNTPLQGSLCVRLGVPRHHRPQLYILRALRVTASWFRTQSAHLSAHLGQRLAHRPGRLATVREGVKAQGTSWYGKSVYPSDLADAEWALLATLLLPAKSGGHHVRSTCRSARVGFFISCGRGVPGATCRATTARVPRCITMFACGGVTVRGNE